MSVNNGFTPTEHRILAILADGQPHLREEIHACLWDEMAALSAIQAHISKIRQRLRPRGQDIVCVTRGRLYYQHVRLLASAADGKR